MQPYKLSEHEADMIISAYINQVFIWLTAGFTLSGLAAHVTATSESMNKFVHENMLIIILLVLLELFFVFLIKVYLEDMSSLIAVGVYVCYSVATGVGLAAILIIIPLVTISKVFCVLSITFMIMSVYGYLVRHDMTDEGSIIKLLLIGVAVAALINLLIQHSFLDFAVSCAGIVFFAAMLTHKRRILHEFALRDEIPEELREGPKDIDETSHFAIIGALRLYLFR